MDKGWLSVVIAAYNAEQFLADTVDSILLQSVLPSQIILVDDGSTDSTPAICDDYVKKYSGEGELPGCEMIAVHQPNGGHTSARKKGLELAVGEYVLIMDADDLLATGILEELHGIATHSDPDVICFNYASFKQIDNIKPEKLRFEEGLYTRQMACEAIFPRMLFTGEWYRFGIAPNMWNKLFRRNLAEFALSEVPESIKHGEDGIMTYRAILMAESIYITNTIGYLYRSTSGSISYRSNLKRSVENIELFNIYKEMFNSLSEEEYGDVRYSLLATLDYYIVYQCLNAMEPELKAVKTSKDKTAIRAQKQQFAQVFREPIVKDAFRAVKLVLIDGKKNKLSVIKGIIAGASKKQAD